MKQEIQTGLCQEAGALTLINNLITYDSMFELQHDREFKGTALPETEQLYVTGEFQPLSKTHPAFPLPYTDHPSPQHGLRDEIK